MGNIPSFLPPPFAKLTTYSIADVEEITRRYALLTTTNTSSTINNGDNKELVTTVSISNRNIVGLPILACSGNELKTIFQGTAGINSSLILDVFVKSRVTSNNTNDKRVKNSEGGEEALTGGGTGNTRVSTLAVISPLIILCNDSAAMRTKLSLLFNFYLSFHPIQSRSNGNKNDEKVANFTGVMTLGVSLIRGLVTMCCAELLNGGGGIPAHLRVNVSGIERVVGKLFMVEKEGGEENSKTENGALNEVNEQQFVDFCCQFFDGEEEVGAGAAAEDVDSGAESFKWLEGIMAKFS